MSENSDLRERARELGEALTYIAGSVGAREHERRIAREALEGITAQRTKSATGSNLLRGRKGYEG